MKSWINEATFYHVYPLGFCGAPDINQQGIQAINRIRKIEEWTQHMKSLGVNAIYLGPVFESKTHGYDTTDYYHIDKRLGSDEDFKRVCDHLHENGIRIVLDGVFNHVGRDFWAFRDVMQYGQSSKYCNWFSNLRFDGHSPFGDSFRYDCWEGHFNLVKLNLKNPEVKEHLLGAVGSWIDEYQIDGLRLDAADCVDIEFLKELASYCKRKKPDFWLMGEIIHGDYHTWANGDTLDSVTNYECYKGLYSSHNDKNYFEIAYSLKRQFGEGGIYKDLLLYSFIDNHDVNRIGSTVKNKAHLYPIHILLFTIPGVPSIYYGSEWGLYGEKHNHSDAPLRPDLDLQFSSTHSPHKDLAKTISLLSSIRQNTEALKYGLYQEVLVTNEQFVFSRTIENEKIIVALNLSTEEKSMEIHVPKTNGSAKDLLNHYESISIEEGKMQMTIPPCWGKIIKL